MNFEKYLPFQPINLKERKWPTRTITKAPIWCSVDLRDGNQALETPMTLDEKVEFFNQLVKIGFKEIEVGFPAASDTEYMFLRTLIDNNLIPDDVTIQVLTQSREHILEKTFESLEGVKRAIVHFYNSTSTLQREVVFEKNMPEIIEIAVSGAKTCMELAKKYGEERFLFQYSPESFTGTELPFAVEICNAVIDVIKPTTERKLIINLPSTVEMATPNVYADQIEYMCENLKEREKLIVCLHAHNDRGTGVASSELGVLAGADRVEGTLFGNGERTGNADIMTLGMNLYSQGIDPKLDFSEIDKIVELYEKFTKLAVHPRHPWAGDLVYTAFSGSHQDAINKGMAKMEGKKIWSVPYLPIDPMDIGRSYDPIIRINSQSGKGGVAFILEKDFGVVVPKNMQQDFSAVIKKETDSKSKELSPQEIYNIFKDEYININTPFELISYAETNEETTNVIVEIIYKGEKIKIKGCGNGLIDAFSTAIASVLETKFLVVNYTEHSLDYGTGARAITYVELKTDDNRRFFGAGLSRSISKSSLNAIVSAVNKMF